MKTVSADLNYQFSSNGYNVRVTGFYTKIMDQTDMMSFYDDSQNSFTNFAMSGIDQRHMGIELGFKVPLPVKGLALNGQDLEGCVCVVSLCLCTYLHYCSPFPVFRSSSS